MNFSSLGTLFFDDRHVEQHPQLSPSALKQFDRFRHLTGFTRVTIQQLGHAVVATYLGHPLTKVTIEADGIPDSGECLYETEIPLHRIVITEYAVISVAGFAAVDLALSLEKLNGFERACSTGLYPYEYGADLEVLCGCAQLLNIPQASFELWKEDLSRAAEDLLRVPYVWSALTRLAKELEDKKTLTGERVCEVLASCKEQDETIA